MSRFDLERLAFPWKEPRDCKPRPPRGYHGPDGYHGPPSPPPWALHSQAKSDFNQGEARC